MWSSDVSFLDGRKSNRLNCCSGCCAVEFPLRRNISNRERPGKGFLPRCRLAATVRHDLFPFELARDGGDMHCVSAEARVLAEVGFHPLFNFGIVQSLDARSMRLFQFLAVEVVWNLPHPLRCRAAGIGSARMIGILSNHNPHDECKRWCDGSAGGATFTGGIRLPRCGRATTWSGDIIRFRGGRGQSLSPLEQARGSEGDAEKAKVFVW